LPRVCYDDEGFFRRREIVSDDAFSFTSPLVECVLESDLVFNAEVSTTETLGRHGLTDDQSWIGDISARHSLYIGLSIEPI
jgi:hypothetical protein